METHHQVQHTDHHHGHKKEAHGGDLHDHVIDPQGPQNSAYGRLLHPLWQGEDAMQRCVGDGTDHWHNPHIGDDPLGVLISWQVTCFERVQHGDVPLHAQNCDIEDGGKADRLKEEGLEVAANLAKGEGVVLPQFVNLQGHPKQKHEEVRQSQAHQVEVGGVLHLLVPRYYRACEQISRQTGEEDEKVDTGHREEEGRLFWTQDFSQVDLSGLAVGVIPSEILWHAAVMEQFRYIWIRALQWELHFREERRASVNTSCAAFWVWSLEVCKKKEKRIVLD